MSLQAIADLARELAIRAADQEIEPYSPASASEFDNWDRRIPIPNIGDYRPDGWRLIDYVTVDKTGFGQSWEPALTIPAFIKWAAEKWQADNQAGFAIIEEGQFQLVVGYFTTDDEIEAETDDSNGIKAEDLNIEHCPECGFPYDGDDEDIKECPDCHTKLVDPLFYDGEKVTIPEPGAMDDWPAGETWVVEGDYYKEKTYLTLKDSQGDEWDIEWHLVSKVYHPENDPAQPCLMP